MMVDKELLLAMPRFDYDRHGDWKPYCPQCIERGVWCYPRWWDDGSQVNWNCPHPVCDWVGSHVCKKDCVCGTGFTNEIGTHDDWEPWYVEFEVSE